MVARSEDDCKRGLAADEAASFVSVSATAAGRICGLMMTGARSATWLDEGAAGATRTRPANFGIFAIASMWTATNADAGAISAKHIKTRAGQRARRGRCATLCQKIASNNSAVAAIAR